MKILINDQRNIFAIQKEFNSAFPFLNIEFFSKSNKESGVPAFKNIKQGNKTLGECRTIHNDDEINITSSMTIKDLEQNFLDIYGLGINIFRKSGKAWLETTVTSNWTLEEQNSQGKALSESSGEIIKP